MADTEWWQQEGSPTTASEAYGTNTNKSEEYYGAIPWSWSPESAAATAKYNARNTSDSAVPNSGSNMRYTGSTGTTGTSNSTLQNISNNMSSYLSSFNAANTPTFKSTPTLTVPEYDESEAKRIGYEQAAPYISQLKSTVNRAVARALGLPTSPGQALTMRSIFSDLGTGIAKAQEAGANYGRSVYGDIYNTKVNTAYKQFAADTASTQYENQSLQNQYNLAFQAAMQAWTKSLT